MATTVTPSTATITITENIVLNGVSYGNSIDKSYESQGEVIQRIMSIDTTFTDIFYTSTVDGLGQVVAADWGYFRITNLDDANYMRLRLYNGTDSVFLKLSAGQSFLLMNADTGIDVGGTTFNSLANITQIAASAPNAECDAEVLMITAPLS